MEDTQRIDPPWPEDPTLCDHEWVDKGSYEQCWKCGATRAKKGGMMREIHFAVVAATHMVTNMLSDAELAAIGLATLTGIDPRPVLGYKKASSLFSENNGTRMHRDTLAVLEQIIDERLGGEHDTIPTPAS